MGQTQGSFMGFMRHDGRVGTRSHILVAPTVICASAVASQVAARLPGAIAIPHPHGCNFDRDLNARLIKVLTGLASHPNVYATLFIGLGCETVHAGPLCEMVLAGGYRCAALEIQQSGGHGQSVERGVELMQTWAEEARAQSRQEVDLSHIVLGVECGGSDAFSGLSANPALGIASDLLVAHGGTVVLSEVTEMLGAEHLLVARAEDPAVKEAILAMIARDECEVASLGLGHEGGSLALAPGNMDGGLTSIEEKSLGCIRKGGSTPVVDCLGYADRPTRVGLNLMDTPGYDVQSVTGKAAGGANVIAFTTGRGTPTGCCIVPVVKIASNSRIAMGLSDMIDVSTGGVIDGFQTLDEAGLAVFERIVSAASGAPTRSEINGHIEFDVAPVFHVRELLERGARRHCEETGA